MKDNNISQAGGPAGAPLQWQARPRHRILVVDDDISMRALNTEVLIHSGYHVDAAEDGAVAWETLQRSNYDLLVTDNRMPKLSGVELLKKLRDARMALPVIMATGIAPKEELSQYPGLQPAATLLKPYTVTEFLGAVQEVLRANGGIRPHGEILPAAGSGASVPPVSRAEQIAPPPNGQSQPAADGWLL